MSITNYTELKTAVANFLARSDLTDRIPEFISLAEGRLSRELESRYPVPNKSAPPGDGEADPLLGQSAPLRQRGL